MIDFFLDIIWVIYNADIWFAISYFQQEIYTITSKHLKYYLLGPPVRHCWDHQKSSTYYGSLQFVATLISICHSFKGNFGTWVEKSVIVSLRKKRLFGWIENICVLQNFVTFHLIPICWGQVVTHKIAR